MRVNLAVRESEAERNLCSTIYFDKLSARSKPIYEFFKRMFDIVSSFLALVVLSPLMAVVGLIIFLQDFHNPFFVQTRLTKDGQEFKMIKFRSMCVNAEEQLENLKSKNEVEGPVFKMEDDPRVTKFGRFIRRTSIDELPQLINILSGAMSVVGPRPPLPKEVEQYTPYHMQRLCVKGGLTCYWQCSGRSNVGFDDWVDMDVQYIKERSVLTDFKIILKTFKAVLKRDGAK